MTQERIDKFDLGFDESKDLTPDFYREVFLKGNGPIVLNDILLICHYGEDLNPNDPVKIAEYNVGLRILRRCCQGEGKFKEVLSFLATYDKAITKEVEK